MGGNESKKDKKESEGYSTGTIVGVGLIAAAAGAVITYLAKKQKQNIRVLQTNLQRTLGNQLEVKSKIAQLSHFSAEQPMDPVQTPAGHSYERSAIVQWIKQHGTDPLTFQPLKEEDVRPNIDLRNSIQDYLATLK